MSEPSPRPGSAELRPRPSHLPYPVVLAAWWSLCLLLIAAGLWLLGKVVGSLPVVVVPVAVAVLLSAMLHPVVTALQRFLRLPRLAAALLTVLALIAVIIGGIALITQQVVADFPNLRDKATAGVDQIAEWLDSGPLELGSNQISDALAKAQTTLSEHSSELATSAVRAGGQAVEVVAGTFIGLIALFFFLFQGRRLWSFFVGLAPAAARGPLDGAARRGWVSLGAFTHTQALVAAINATCVGVGAAILGVPFALPIAVIVFLASFVPIVGTLVSGALPALIALVENGLWSAVIMVVIVVVVHQVESHVLQPFLMGHAVALHPLAVILIVAAGTYLFGLAGALFAVPVAATLNAAIRYLVGDDMFPRLDATDPDAPPAAADADTTRSATLSPTDAPPTENGPGEGSSDVIEHGPGHPTPGTTT